MISGPAVFNVTAPGGEIIGNGSFVLQRSHVLIFFFGTDEDSWVVSRA